MNKNPSTPSARPDSTGKFHFTGSHVATAAMFLIVLFIWRDLTHTKKAMRQLQLENRTLDARLEESAANLEQTTRQLDQYRLGGPQMVSPAPSKKTLRPTAKPAEVPETLFLQEPTVRQTTDGLTARFEFKPDDATPLPERITLVVRVPGSSPARILSLNAVAAPDPSNLECVVNSKGNLAMIEGTPDDLAALVFELTVSEPVKATVRGSRGIKPFELDIQPGGCTVRRL